MSISREGTLSRQFLPLGGGGGGNEGAPMRPPSSSAGGEPEGHIQGTLGRTGSAGGGGARTPPPRIRSGKMMAVKVKMLDDSITLFQVQVKAPGKILFDQVCKQLNLLEVDYFGLEYQDQFGVTYWVDIEKQMNHQIALTSLEPLFLFCVKFYTPDPAQIEEEYTRYLFSLQIKRDLATGLLQCNDNTAALMASYIVQAECGDYVVEDYPDHTYLSSFKFVPQQDSDLERRIMENHKKHVGQSPAEADLNLLETARRCELYGTKMHSAKDHEGMPLNLAVAHMGVVVFQNYTKINTFSWAKIRKLSFKRKRYIIKLHPEGYGYYRDTVEFYFEDRNQCKNFWKKCVEHHGFFRCSSSGTLTKEREKRRIIPRGSSFRYSGKTQKEMQEFVRENFVKRQSFHSRHARNLHSSMGNVSQSLSAQPLLPLGDALAASEGNLASSNCPRLLPPQRGRGGSLHPPPVLVSHVSELRLDPLNFDFKEEENDDEDEDLLRRGIVGSGIVHPDYGSLPGAVPQPVYSVVGNLYAAPSVKGPLSEAPPATAVQEEREEEEVSEEEDPCISSEDNLSHDSYDLIDKEEEDKKQERHHHLRTRPPPQSSSLASSSLPNTLLRKDKPPFYTPAKNLHIQTLPHIYRSDAKKERSSPEGIVIYDDFGEDYPPPSSQMAPEGPKEPQEELDVETSTRRNNFRYFSLPRNNYDTYFVQQPVNPALNRYFVNESMASKTLPRSRPPNLSTPPTTSTSNNTTKDPIVSSALGTVMKNDLGNKDGLLILGGGTPSSASRLKECSSGSSSSHASPRVARPQSLDFASAQTESSFLRNHNMDEDSSSAVSGMCPVTNLHPGHTRHPNILEYNYASSSDVPQTPEGANPFRRDYEEEEEDFLEEERIYDVPEGIEGLDKPIIVAHLLRRQSKSSSRVVSFAPTNKYHKINSVHPIPPPRNDVHGAPYPKLRTQLSLVKPRRPAESSKEKPPPIIATPTNRNLLPMSSTESESISAARSAPTPLTAPSAPNKENRLLPSPPEESESSLTVLDSESVPAPPEFASIESRENPSKATAAAEDTDVDEEDGAVFSMKNPPPGALEESLSHSADILEGIMEEDEVYEVAIDGEIELEIVDATTSEVIRLEVKKEELEVEDYPSQTLSAPPVILSDNTKKKKDSDSSSSTKDGTTDSALKMAEMYVRLGNGSTDNDDSSVFPNLEYEEAAISEILNEPQEQRSAYFPSKDHPETVYIDSGHLDLPSPPLAPSATIIIASSHPPPPQMSFEEDEVTTEAATTVLERSSPTSTSEIDLSVIPPPPEEHSTPYILEGGPAYSPPYQPRALSRISERSSFEKDEEDDEITPPCRVVSGGSTSDDANKSLSSDVPLSRGQDHGATSPGFPSPPSSLQIASLISAKEEPLGGGDSSSLCLEITPPDFDNSLSEEGAGVPIPYDLSASSNEPHKAAIDAPPAKEKEQRCHFSDEEEEDSLHHSMEILEDVTTEDHFEELRHEDDELSPPGSSSMIFGDEVVL